MVKALSYRKEHVLESRDKHLPDLSDSSSPTSRPLFLGLEALAAVYPNHNSVMSVFPRKKYQSAAANTFAASYRAAIARHPFLLFGLPFMAVIVGGSFVLTPATAVRYERHDRKVRQLTREEELSVGKAGRKVDIREEYFVNYEPT